MEDEFKFYEKAKEISDKVVEFSKKIIKEGLSIRELAESIEKKIEELGGRPAFPTNVCINDIAAHYSPDIDDETRITSDDLVKVDIGVHFNGYIWDRAFTVCLSKKYNSLIKASEKALKEAIKLIKPGVKVFQISEVVEETLKELGFNPIRNLCGHGLQRFILHAKPTIPNGRNNIQDEIREKQVIAMEVFSTDGGGWVKESDVALIYSFKEDKPVRMWEARKILSKAKEEFNCLPFAKRWLKEFPKAKVEIALRQLVEVGALKSYPVLREVTGGRVAQTEETILVK